MAEPAPVASRTRGGPKANITASSEWGDPPSHSASFINAAASAVPATSPEANAAVEPCTATDVEVVPVTDSAEYLDGAKPEFSFTIANVGSDPCTVNAGTSTQVFTVTSGEDTIWVSTDCQTDPIDGLITLEPDEPISSASFTWDRVWSDSETCDDENREEVVAEGATYNLSVEVDGISSKDAKSFLLF